MRFPVIMPEPTIPMADAPRHAIAELMAEDELTRRVAALAADVAPRIDDETVTVCLLTGGLWFAADLTRALARLDRHPLFDSLWLSSYADGRSSRGRVEVRAGPQRSLAGRRVLLIDDVIDSGLSLAEAAAIMTAAGAGEILSAVFARKPWPTPRALEPDFVAWEAPARYLVGYGMDDAGRLRGLPGVGALD
jgi:hypoxanthine phosphoribosyltransferase